MSFVHSLPHLARSHLMHPHLTHSHLMHPHLMHPQSTPYSFTPDASIRTRCTQVVVISGETGCGKTTQVPQFLLDAAIDAGRWVWTVFTLMWMCSRARLRVCSPTSCVPSRAASAASHTSPSFPAPPHTGAPPPTSCTQPRRISLPSKSPPLPPLQGRHVQHCVHPAAPHQRHLSRPEGGRGAGRGAWTHRRLCHPHGELPLARHAPAALHHRRTGEG